MKITFPHMGTLWIPLKTLLTQLGNQVVVPPPITQKTIEIGNKYSPEYACLPLKINLGNFIEALERGADTIVMGGGTGPCRFGYYGQIQRDILKELGYSFNMIILEPPQGNFYQLLGSISSLNNQKTFSKVIKAFRIMWLKLQSIEKIERLLHQARPLEKYKGVSSKIFHSFLANLDKENDPPNILQLTREAEKSLKNIEKKQAIPSFKVALIGEIYMLNEPAVNINIEKKIGELGGFIERNIYISEWIRDNLFKDPRRHFKRKKIQKAAQPYLNHFVGGHGWETVGESLIYSQQGFDGIIHIMPFTCSPEIVAQTCFPLIMKKYNTPIISLSLDEHAGEAGLITRLEAFSDLILQKKNNTGSMSKPTKISI